MVDLVFFLFIFFCTTYYYLLLLQAWYLLRAESWNEAHKVIVEKIAPDAIINDDYEFFFSLLLDLANLQHEDNDGGGGDGGSKSSTTTKKVTNWPKKKVTKWPKKKLPTDRHMKKLPTCNVTNWPVTNWPTTIIYDYLLPPILWQMNLESIRH